MLMSSTVHTDSRIDTSVAVRAVNEQELESARNTVSQSPMSRVAFLPNHNVGRDGQLQGFFFGCHADDSAAVLPMHNRMFETTAVYCVSTPGRGSKTSGFDATALKIAQNTAWADDALKRVAAYLQQKQSADFSCMPSTNLADQVNGRWCDSRAWAPDVPIRMGVYHAFSRSHLVDEREHKLFIVVTGSLRRCGDELFNMWEDAKDHITCRQFLECEEIQWMRRATERSLHQIAALLVRALDLEPGGILSDHESAGTPEMLYPSTTSNIFDMRLRGNEVHVVSQGCFSDTAYNGCVFDVFGEEGYRIHCGPRDTSEFSLFGTLWSSNKKIPAMPTRAVLFHDGYPVRSFSNVVQINEYSGLRATRFGVIDSLAYVLFPDEDFAKALQALGFDRNDGMLELMPLVFWQREQQAGAQRQAFPTYSELELEQAVDAVCGDLLLLDASGD